MTLKDLRAALFSALTAALSARGYRRREQSFVRPIPGGAAIFHVTFINHADDFDVTADVAVRYDAIEDRLNAARPLLSPRERRQTATVGAQLAHIAGIGVERWTVRDAAEVALTARGIVERLVEVGEPFLQRFASPAEVRRVLEEDGAEARLICPFREKRLAIREALRQVLEGSAV
jgi:hypothetical protein